MSSATTTTAAVVPRRGGGARRGGRFGGKPSTGSVTNAAAAQPDDTEAVRNLRAKYADKLVLLRELFSDWTDEDLLFSLQEAGGEVELAVGRISEGHAEQFNSVKSKKQTKKDALSTATPASFHGQHGGTNGTATILTSSRGGRGGANAARGGRGGGAVRGARGGARGGAIRGTGRGGASGIATTGESGEASTVPVASTSTGTTWADAVAATSASKNGASSSAWEDDTEGLNLKTQKATEEEQPSSALATSSNDAEESKEEAKQAGPIVSAIQKVTSKLVPKGSKLSWAQVARPAEPPKEQSQPPKEAPTAPAAQRAQNPTSAAAKTSEPIKPDATVVAPVTEPASESVIEPASTTEPQAVPSSTAVEADPVNVTASSASEIEPSSTTQGAARPAASRSVQSQRALQRAKQDAPVVMPGGNAQLDNLGMRFGGLSFLGGDNADASTEPQAIAAPAVEQSSPAAATTASVPTHQDAFTQATSTQNFTDKEAYSAHQQGYQQGLQQHQQAHQAAVSQAQAQHQAIAGLPSQQASQIQQQPLDQQQTSQYQQAASGYNSQGQQIQQQAQTQTPQTNASAQQGSQQSYGDYSSMYGGLDAQRLAGYYGAYDSSAAARGNEERSTFGSQAVGEAQQSTNATQTESSSVGAAPQIAPQQQQQQQQQQQFPNMMPYYYPQFYLPNQFQHFGQPAAGYGQYALYSGQPQHPNKPNAPASLQSPYAQNLPHSDTASSNPYGNAGNVSQYNQSPANTSALSSSAYTDYGRGVPSSNTADYSKLYGSNNGVNNGSIANSGSSIPGLSGFLGQQPSNGSNGTSTQNKAQSTANVTNTSSLDNAYRQYDSSKLGGPSPVRQGASVGVTGNQSQQLNGQGQIPSGTQSQGQNLQSQQPQQPQQAQQHQHYYQQYNAYAGHQQPNNASANYGSYPYRQYWGQ